METTINIAAIVGGTIGGVVLLILITLLGLYIYWRYEPREDETDPDVSSARARALVCVYIYIPEFKARYYYLLTSDAITIIMFSK